MEETWLQPLFFIPVVKNNHNKRPNATFQLKFLMIRTI